MHYARYEIRYYYYGTGEDFDYVPFDNLEEAKRYINKHQAEIINTKHQKTGLYLVYLYSEYDMAKEVYNYYVEKSKAKNLITNISEWNNTREYIYKLAKRYGLIKYIRREGLWS